MFKEIQAYFYSQALRTALKKTGAIERYKLPTSQIKSVGILFDASDPVTFKEVTKFIKELDLKNIDLLGYLPVSAKKNGAQEVPFNHFFKDDVNWYGIPSGKKVSDFQDKKFDLFIHLGLAENTTLEYLVANSKARFRVGPYQANKEYCYDLMISSKATDTLAEFSRQVVRYLTLINP